MATTGDSFERALTGARREGLAEAEYHALYGRIVYFATNGDYREALATAGQLGTLAAAIGDPRAIVTHRRLSAVASTFAGDHAGVRDHAQYVLGHLSSLSGKTRIDGMFFDQRISSRTMLARTLWLQGFAYQAQDCAQEGLALPRSVDHALSLSFVLAHAVVPIALWRGELPVATEMTRLLLSRSQEHGFFIRHGFGRAYQAALQPDARPTLVEPTRPVMGALLLETLATLDETLADNEVLARGETDRAGWCTPELLRISARRLLVPGGGDLERAEALMLRSIETARRQGALSWELRTAISLTELWQSEGRRDRASDLLASTRSRLNNCSTAKSSSSTPHSKGQQGYETATMPSAVRVDIGSVGELGCEAKVGVGQVGVPAAGRRVDQARFRQVRTGRRARRCRQAKHRARPRLRAGLLSMIGSTGVTRYRIGA